MLPLATMTTGKQMLREMGAFGELPPAAQRYIRRSLQVQAGDTEIFTGVARTTSEIKSIGRQIGLYRGIDKVIAAIPVDEDIASISRFMSRILPLVAFDMAEQKLESFAAFRFLYERLLGAEARPWLPAAFMMFASLPEVHPNRRLDLLGSVGTDAVTSHCSTWEPQFFPEWIEELVGKESD